MLIVSNDDYYAEADEYGNLLLYTGVLRRVQSESELAAVLGHELGHVMLDHVKSRASAKSLPGGVESLSALAIAAGQLHGGTGAPVATTGGSDFASHGFYYSLGTSILLEDVLMPAFNRNQERDADRVAVRQERQRILRCVTADADDVGGRRRVVSARHTAHESDGS